VADAIAEYRAALKRDPNDALSLNHLAWILATCPEARLRDTEQAVKLARQAVKLAPKAGTFWNTLGAALYRAGDWKGAIPALEKSMELGKGGDASDWFFLAMAHQQIGKKDEARRWFDKAAQWMDKNRPRDKELRRFRIEAAALLGVKEAPAEKASPPSGK
jgi:tetratricopeptide (TPR) repeat protein